MGRVLVQQPGTNTAKALSETLPKNVIIVDEDLKELRLHDGVTPGGKIIGQNTGSGIPIGTIIPFAGNSVPQGYLLCDGSAISRTDYASLFAVIGTIYGAGDGNSTFNLPDWRDWFYSVMPDFTSASTLVSPLSDNGWVIDRAVNINTVVSIDNVAVAQGNWQSGRWSGNLNLQMLASKGSTVTGTTDNSLFVPIVKSKPYSYWCIKY